MKSGKFFVSIIFLLFLLIAFLVRLNFIPSQRLWPDEALYASQATEIGHNITFLFSQEANEFHVPLFSFFLSWGRSLLDPPIEGYRFLTIVFNWAGLWVTFLLARNMLGVRTAIFALAFLALNRGYFSNAGFILADGLMSATQALFILSLYRLKRFFPEGVILFLFSALLLIYLKWYAILFVLPITAGYFLSPASFLRIKKILPWLCVVCFASIPVLFKILSIMKAGGPAIFHPTPWWFYFSLNSQITGGLLPLIFSVYGLFVLRIRKPEVFLLLILWLAAYFGILSCVSEKDIRYLLPIMLCIAILGGYGLNRAIQVFFNTALLRQAAFKCITVLLLVFSFLCFLKIDGKFLHSYTGFYETGEWIKRNSSVDTVILAGSTRAIRFITGIPLKRFGGRLEPLPGSFEDLKTIVLQSKSVILEIDRWEYTQPQWAYPLTVSKAQALERVAGLHFSKVIYKKYDGKKIPVVWLFTK